MPFAGLSAEVIAHRGASAHAPEHTFAAFDLALAHGADTLELDLRATRDGHVVVLHDPTLARTHADPRPVADTRLADAPAVLTLRAVLERYAGRVGLLLELKAPATPVDAVVALARDVPGVVVQSFDAAALRRAGQLAPALPLARLFASAPTGRQLDRAAARGHEGVGVPCEVVDAALVGAVHLRGLRLRAYTANAPEELRRLAALGVDGLITDAPDRAREAAAAPLTAAA